ncbi:MAG: hypothetical protein AAGA03_17045, partial [Planctomycetota bacterium]
ERKGTELLFSSEIEPALSSEPVMSFPVDGGKGRWHLPKERLDKYVERYPNIDVPTELTKALQWIEDNPKRRKTHQGMPRFLTDWMNRTTDRQSRKPNHSGRKTAAVGPGQVHDPNAQKKDDGF